MIRTVVPENVYILRYNRARNQLLGSNKSIFGFRKQSDAIAISKMIDINNMSVWHTNVRANKFMIFSKNDLRVHAACANSNDVCIEITHDIVKDLSFYNLSVRIIDSIEKETDCIFSLYSEIDIVKPCTTTDYIEHLSVVWWHN